MKTRNRMLLSTSLYVLVMQITRMELKAAMLKRVEKLKAQREAAMQKMENAR